MKRLAAALALTASLAATAPAKETAAPGDLAALTDGVADVGSPGLPGSVAVWSDSAFPVIVGKSDGARVPVVAAAGWGKGRVVAFSHDGYLSAGSAPAGGTGRLVVNAIRWSAQGAPRGGRPRAAVVGCDLAGFAQTSGIDAETLPVRAFGGRLAKFDALVLATNALDADDLGAIGEFVRKGGGLVVAQTGWGWRQVHGGAEMTTNPLNRLLAPAGLGWTDATVEDTGGAGFTSKPAPPRLSHGLAAIDFLLASESGSPEAADLAQAAAAAIETVRLLPADETSIRPRLAAALRRRAAKLVPTQKDPLAAKDALDRFLLAVEAESLWRLAPKDVRAHPAAATFPGAVPAGSPAVSRTVAVDLRVPRWRSTGLYAPPGEVVTATLPEDAPAGLALRIGCHTDALWHLASWPRVPEISRQWALRPGATETASPFGGLVYVVVPEGAGGGVVRVRIDGAVEAPFFELGRTTAAEWKKARRAPGPWAEIASERIVLSVPSSVVRDLEDPAPIAEFWVRVSDAAADLGAIPREPPCAERYAADVEISAGYMHSGYPIMTHLDAAPRMVSIETMTRGDWGLFHEFGHNHQVGDWTFEGTGEVTNNLWSLHLHDVLTKTKGVDAHPAFRGREARVAKHFAEGVKFGAWKADPFLALFMYCQLQEAFGWDAFKKVFAEYRALPEGERPKSDDAKRDQWMTRFSRAVGRDLGPFFEAWGVPTSKAARDSVAKLPKWMPPGFPPK